MPKLVSVKTQDHVVCSSRHYLLKLNVVEDVLLSRLPVADGLWIGMLVTAWQSRSAAGTASAPVIGGYRAVSRRRRHTRRDV